MHGRGDDPSRFRKLYEGMPLDATVILPRAPEQLRPKAYSWFASSRTTPPAELARQIGAQADRIAEGMQAAPVPMDRVIVTGFSQGGMLSFALATRHPERVAVALPLGGALPVDLFPDGRGDTKIRAFHGAIDQVVPLTPTKEAVARLDAEGWNVSLKTYDGVGHTVPRAMQVDYLAALQEACKGG